MADDWDFRFRGLHYCVLEDDTVTVHKADEVQLFFLNILKLFFSLFFCAELLSPLLAVRLQ